MDHNPFVHSQPHSIQNQINGLSARLSSFQEFVSNCLQLPNTVQVLERVRNDVALALSQVHEAERRLASLQNNQKTIDSNVENKTTAAARGFFEQLDRKLEENLDEKLLSRVKDGRVEVALDDELEVNISSIRDANHKNRRDINDLQKAIAALEDFHGRPQGLATAPPRTAPPTPAALCGSENTREQRDALPVRNPLQLDSRNFLKFLRNMDFGKAEHLLRLQRMQFDPGDGQLFEYNTDDGQTKYQYTVKIDRDYATHLGSEYLVRPVFRPLLAIESVLLEMSTSSSGSEAQPTFSKGRRKKVPRVHIFPKYVYEVGEVFFRSVIPALFIILV